MWLLWATLWWHIVITLLLTFLVIERQEEITIFSFLRIIWWIIVIFSLFAFTQGISKWFGILSRNAAYLTYSYLTWLAIVNQRTISLRTVATTWISSLSILISVWYMLLFLSYTKPFDIDCLNLKEQTIGILNQYIPNTTISWNNFLTTITHAIGQIENKTLWQIVWVWSWLSVWLWSWSVLSPQSGTVLFVLESYKTSLIDDFVANKTIVDQWVCNFTLAHIQKITANSTFQISATILWTLLILVFINTLFVIFSFLVFFTLCLLYKMKVYSVDKIQEICETIK